MIFPIFYYHRAYRGGGGNLSTCYLCQVPFSPVSVFVEDFPSLPRIVYFLDVSSVLPRLQKLLTAQGNYFLLVQPFPASFILLLVFYQIMHF